MQAFAPKVLIWWMVAAMAHLPIPVCDGDEVGSLSETAAPGECRLRLDIDFILLGYVGPADVDDGPFHHDPRHDYPVLGLFPPYLWSRGEMSLPIQLRADQLAANPGRQPGDWLTPPAADWAEIGESAFRIADCCRDTCVLRL